MNPEDITRNLSGFTGTESYYSSTFGTLKLTDGVQWLRETLNCYWLIDIVESVQPKLKKNNFQVWGIIVNKDKSWEVTIKEDTNEPVLYKQEGEYTDFPLESFEFYCIDGIVLLKNEY